MKLLMRGPSKLLLEEEQGKLTELTVRNFIPVFGQTNKDTSITLPSLTLKA